MTMTANFYTSSHSNYWLLDEHELELTKHELGTNDITEKDLVVMQIFLADMAHNLGKRMQMKQRVIATAIVYMRRFFAKNSYKACHPLLMVPTVLYLANKVEECGNTNLKTVIGHMVKMALEDYQYLYGDQRVVTVEPKHIVECEFYLLEEMDCYIVIFHPYRSLESIIPEGSRIPPTSNNGATGTNSTSGSAGAVDQSLPKDIRELYQTAWYILNDSYKTDVCLLYAPHSIAVSALYLACTIKDREKKPEVRQWFAELNFDDAFAVDCEKAIKYEPKTGIVHTHARSTGKHAGIEWHETREINAEGNLIWTASMEYKGVSTKNVRTFKRPT